MGKYIFFLSLIMPVFMYGMDKQINNFQGNQSLNNKKRNHSVHTFAYNDFVKKTKEKKTKVCDPIEIPTMTLYTRNGDEEILYTAGSYRVGTPTFTSDGGIDEYPIDNNRLTITCPQLDREALLVEDILNQINIYNPNLKTYQK